MHLGFRERLQPLLKEAQDRAEVELRKVEAGTSTAAQAEMVANLVVLRHDALRHERAWQENLGRAFAVWPRHAAVPVEEFSLVPEGELGAQLVGQSAIRALENRYAGILGIVDGRLWSLAARMGSPDRPPNPFAPQVLVDAFLDTFSAFECDPGLRPILLRHYERLCWDRLGEVYAWLNSELAARGHAMDGGGSGAALVSQPVAGGGAGGWGGRDLVERRDGASWRTAGGAGVQRDWNLQEFMAVLSLVQGEAMPVPPQDAPGSISRRLRQLLLAGGASLGLAHDTSRPSARQDAAIDAVGSLFDGLRGGAVLSPRAQQRLARLAAVYLRIAAEEPQAFSEPAHAIWQVLSILVECWDANPGESEEDAGLHALADDISEALANRYQGEMAVFDRALAALKAGHEPQQRRAAISERRAWQAVAGAERLEAARQEADQALAGRVEGVQVLPAVFEFLSEVWRQALVQAWLRQGPQSQRFTGMLAVGDSLMQLDRDAGAARGAVVAQGLLELRPRLNACYAACGMDESASGEHLARLVAELGRPDAERASPEITPLARSGSPAGAAMDEAGMPVDEGQVMVRRAHGQTPVWLRVAWVSPLTRSCLLVNRQGVRQELLSPEEIAAELASGALVARPVAGLVDAVLRTLPPLPAD